MISLVEAYEAVILDDTDKGTKFDQLSANITENCNVEENATKIKNQNDCREGF